MSKKEHLLPNYASPYRFAQLLGVSSQRILDRIESKEITTVLVGYDKQPMINMADYPNLQFKADPRRKPQTKIKLKKEKKNEKVNVVYISNDTPLL